MPGTLEQREAEWLMDLEREAAEAERVVVEEADENGERRHVVAYGRIRSKRQALAAAVSGVDANAVPEWCSFCARTREETPDGRLIELQTRLGMNPVFCCSTCAPAQAGLLRKAMQTAPRAHGVSL